MGVRGTPGKCGCQVFSLLTIDRERLGGRGTGWFQLNLWPLKTESGRRGNMTRLQGDFGMKRKKPFKVNNRRGADD